MEPTPASAELAPFFNSPPPGRRGRGGGLNTKDGSCCAVIHGKEKK